MPYTYILECADGTYYAGWTTNLEKRLFQHNAGTGSRYTRARLPVKIVYFEEHPTRSLAQCREVYIKKLTRSQKEKLIESKAKPQ